MVIEEEEEWEIEKIMNKEESTRKKQVLSTMEGIHS